LTDLKFIMDWPDARDLDIELSACWTGMTACPFPVVHADYTKLNRIGEGVYGFLNLGT
jgi:hypothetical protein